LQYKVLTSGGGAESKVATIGAWIGIKYEGRLAAEDTKVVSRGTMRLKLGSGQVIPGLELGISGMPVGERRKLFIPYDLAYGEKGSPPEIPPRADMHFVVEVVDAEAVGSDYGNIAVNQSSKAEVTSFAELSAPPFVCGNRRGLVDLDMYSQSEYFGHHHFGHVVTDGLA